MPPLSIELRTSISIVIGSFSFSQRSHYHSENIIIAVNPGHGWRKPTSTGQGIGGLTPALGWLVRNGFTLQSRERLSEYAPPVKQAIKERWFTCTHARLNRFYLMTYERDAA
jgi:hypothetical protein